MWWCCGWFLVWFGGDWRLVFGFGFWFSAGFWHCDAMAFCLSSLFFVGWYNIGGGCGVVCFPVWLVVWWIWCCGCFERWVSRTMFGLLGAAFSVGLDLVM